MIKLLLTLVLMLLILVPFIVTLMMAIIARLCFGWRRKPFLVTGGVLSGIAALFLLYGYVEGRTHFIVKQVEVSHSNLPDAFDGYRVLQLSDLHVGGFIGEPEVMERLVALVNAQKADMIVITGDVVNHRASELEEFEAALSKLSATDGVYSILGNHDYGPYYLWKSEEEKMANGIELELRQERMGWQLLNNEHRFIHHGADSISLIGVENEGEPPFSQHGDLKKAMKGTEGTYQLLLSHNPSHWRREVLPHSDIELMLAGHTHAFQIKLFGWSPAQWRYPEWSGLYTEGERTLYVNEGIGYVMMPFRVGAWPEITVFTLRRS